MRRKAHLHIEHYIGCPYYVFSKKKFSYYSGFIGKTHRIHQKSMSMKHLIIEHRILRIRFVDSRKNQLLICFGMAKLIRKLKHY